MPKVDDVREQSTFQGYLIPLIDEKFVDTLSTTLIYPRDIVEIFQEPNVVFNGRRLGRANNTYLLSIDSFKRQVRFFEKPFLIISCLEEYLGEVRKIMRNSIFKPIIVTDGDGGDLKFEDINDAYVFDNLIYNRIKEFSLKKTPYKKLFTELLGMKRRSNRSIKWNLNEPSVRHNVVVPNEAVLVSCGYTFDGEREINPSLDRSNYISEMIRTANIIGSREITTQKAVNQSDLILYSPSIYSYLYDTEHHFWNRIYRELGSKKKKDFIKKNIIKNINYSGVVFEGIENKEELQEMMYDKFIYPMLYIRRFELRYTTIAIALLSLSNNCAAIRIPNSINFHPKQFKLLELLSMRDDKKGIKAFQKKFSDIIQVIKESIGEDIIEFVCAKSSSLTLCCDVPLEWISFQSIPLMFTHEISRITTTPGNELLSNASHPVQLEFTTDDLKKILIIRSFSPTDPIRNDLKLEIERLPENDLVIETSNVENEDELIIALNKYQGQVVIFDCHGDHGGNESHGWLSIGLDKVDVWTLKYKARIPPVAILSACSTSAVSGSHASVANGLLHAGALSVIGTFFPVNSIKSSTFVTNILFQIAFFLKSLSKEGFKITTWRTLISVVMRVSYIGDVLDGFDSEKKFKDKSIRNAIEVLAVNNIYSMERNWHKQFLELLSKYTEEDAEWVMDEIKEKYSIVETMYYQQIGRPENIIINL
jgi:hypothetical protein